MLIFLAPALTISKLMGLASKHAALLAIPEVTQQPRGHGVPTLLG